MVALVSLLILFLVLFLSTRILYALFFHPLASIPGPWYAALGDWWNEAEQMRLVYSRSIYKLLQEYGPIVRIGQNHVVFIDESAAKIVYGSSSKFPKDPYYKRFITNGNDHSMTILPHTDWSNRRRAVAGHYTPTYLAHFEPEVAKYTRQLVDGLNANAGRSSFDLMSLFRHLQVDVIFAIAFGLDNGTVIKWGRGEIDPMDQAVTDFPKRSIVNGLLPSFLFNTFAYFPSQRVRAFYAADSILASAAKEILDKFNRDAEALKSDTGSEDRKSLLQRVVEYRLPDGKKLEEHEILSEVQAHMIAGAETTATVAAMLIWELTQHPDILTRLRGELDSALPSGEIVDWNTLFSLPYLNAFIKEGLRLYAVIPGPLPRIVPSHVVDLGIQGYRIPPGCTVSTEAYAVHRQPNVYPDPFELKPERWLDGKETDRMRANYMPFGLGSRVCVGQRLGETMLRVIVSSIMVNFDPQPSKETTPATMDIWESFALFPKGLQAKFTLAPRKK